MPISAPSTVQLAARNPGIDIVRGVAIIFVVIHHLAIRIPLPKTALAGFLPHQLLMGLSLNGYEAVFVFFVVSGYLITSHAILHWGALRNLNLRQFYIRRSARILPCLLLLVAILSVLALLQMPDYTITRTGQSLQGAIFSALTLQLNWYEGRTGYLPGGWDVLWSLSIEEMFYLVFPLLCIALGRSTVAVAAFCGVFAGSLPLLLDALMHAPEIWAEKAYFPGMAAIATGVCTALVVSWLPRRHLRHVAALFGWLGCALLASLFWWHSAIFAGLGHNAMLLLTIGTALLMMAFAWGWGSRSAARGTAWLRSFGQMSYEIYLTHMFVVFPIVGLFHRSGGDMSTGWIWFVPTLGLSWVLGGLIARYVSRPADRWLRARFGGSHLAAQMTAISV